MVRKRVKQILDKTDVDDRICSGAKDIADKTTIDDRILGTARKVRHEIRKNISTAILAAFGFMIALVWRDVVTKGVERLISWLNISGSGFLFTLITALLTTLICVFGIIYFSRWSEKK